MSGLLSDDDSNPNLEGLDMSQPPPHHQGGYAWAAEEPQQEDQYEPGYYQAPPQYAPQPQGGYLPPPGHSQSGYAPAWPQQPQYAQQAEAEYVPQQVQLRPMSEAQKRLNKAMLYQQVMEMSVFGSDDPMAQDVEAEFKEWANQKMNALLGVGEEPSTGALATIEIRILKAFATSILQNAKLRSSLGITDGPGVPPAPAPRPRPATAPPPAARPQVRPRPQPVGGQPLQPRPAPQLQPRPMPPRQPQPAPRPQQYQQARPYPQQPVDPRQQWRQPPQGRPVAPAVESMPQDGDVIKEKGRTYKVAWVEMNPGEFGPSSEKRLERLPPHSVTKERGVQIVKTEGEEYFKVVKRDLTPQVRGTGGAPPITDAHQMAAVTAMRSNEAMQSMSPAVHGLAGRLLAE